MLLTHLQGPPSPEWRQQGDHRGLQGSQRKCTTGRKEGPDCEGEAFYRHAAFTCAPQTGWELQIVCLSQSQGIACVI